MKIIRSLEQLLETNYLFINFSTLNLMIIISFYQKYIIINLLKILKKIHFISSLQSIQIFKDYLTKRMNKRI